MCVCDQNGQIIPVGTYAFVVFLNQSGQISLILKDQSNSQIPCRELLFLKQCLKVVLYFSLSYYIKVAEI